MKIGILDIESTDLSADRGFILCACYKLVGKSNPLRTTRIDESKNYGKSGLYLKDDTHCIEEINRWLVKDDIDYLVTYNGKFFDIPYINSRLLKIKHKSLPLFRHIDHWSTSRYKFKLHSHSLDTLARHLDCKETKSFYDIGVWQNAAFGHKPSLNKIVSHCQIDVRVLEECHNKIMPMLRELKGLY